MGWKDLPYWLKGGIITVIIVFILFLVGSGLEKLYGVKSDMGTPTIWIFIVFPTLPFILLFSFLGIPQLGSFSSVLFIVIPILEFFLIGAIIGWIVGKIKSKKEQ